MYGSLVGRWTDTTASTRGGTKHTTEHKKMVDMSIDMAVFLLHAHT